MFAEEEHGEKGGGYRADKVYEESLEEWGQIKVVVKELLGRLMREEQVLYLVDHHTKANGHSTRGLLTFAGLGRASGFPMSARGVYPKITF